MGLRKCPAELLDSIMALEFFIAFPLHFYKSSLILLSKRKGNGMPERIELPQGTLDLLILRTLLPGPQHGWAISERVQQVSSEVLSIQQGSLYPALHRLERRGWIKAQWGTSENNRRAKYYELTRIGEQAARAGNRSLAQADGGRGAGSGRSVTCHAG